MSILAEHLTKSYSDRKAVDDLSFSVSPGQVVGFLGPNGAGKSTTMRILTCYMAADSGKASICGFDVQENSLEARRRIGYLPESNPLYPDMYVREYLGFHAAIHGLGKEADTRIKTLIAMTGLGPEQNKKIGALSKGYRQRVGLAQALLHDPEVLILDEPTSGLDPNQLVEIRDLIRDLGKDKTVLLSTHILQEVKAICERVIILSGGKIVADSPVQVLQQQGKDEHVVTVEFSGGPSDENLGDVFGAAVVKQGGPRLWMVTTTEPEEASKKLMHFALRNNLNIVSLQSSSRSLEEIFRQLTDQRPS